MNCDLTQLLADDARWLRRLAQRLACDGSTGDDLLHELWLRTFGRKLPDPARRGPWLARVLRNLARQEHRGRDRRAARERLCARPEATPAADEVAARLEVQRLLLDELASLEEPFRSVLVMRYQDDLSPSAIARRLGIPAGTVRWRLHTGLSRLRERLDRRHGGRRDAWVLGFAPLLHASGRRGVLGSVRRRLLRMTSSTPSAAGVCAAALAVLALWIGLASAPGPLRFGSAPVEEIERALDPNGSGATAHARSREAVVLPASGAELVAAEPSAHEGTARIEGRVLDAALRPLASASAKTESPRRGEQSVAKPGEIRADCGSDGRFAMEFAAEAITGTDPVELRVQAPDHATRIVHVRILPGTTVQAGDILLGVGARVAGCVRAPSGEPAAHARVVVARPRCAHADEIDSGPLREPESAAVTCDAQGRFEAEGSPAGPVRVWARGASSEGNESTGWARTEILELVKGEARAGLELVLPHDVGLAATAIRGSVRTPRGDPIAGARIHVDARAGSERTQTTVVADADGRFAYDPRRPCLIELVAEGPEGSWGSRRSVGIEAGARDVELVLGEPRWIDVKVRDARGSTPAGCEVRARFESRSFGTGARATDEHRDASHRRLAVPFEPFFVEVAAPGFARARFGPFAPESAPAELDCVLDAVPGLRGRVLHHGAPVAGATLELWRRADEQEAVAQSGFPQKVWCQSEETVSSAADGSFLLSGREAGAHFLQCRAGGFALAEIELDVDPERGARDLVLELVRGGAISGVVRARAGRDPAGTIVAINRFDGHPRTQRADALGRFRFENLTPGPWRVERAPQELGDGDGFTVDDGRFSDHPRATPSCVVADGATSETEIDLTSDEPARLDACIAVNGAPAAGWSIALWPAGKSAMLGEVSGGVLDARGRGSFEIDPGRYEARFEPPDARDASGVARLDLDLPPGATPLEARLATTALDGRYLGAPQGVVAVWTARAPGGLRACTVLELDQHGRFLGEAVLAGIGVLELMRRDGEVILRRPLDLTKTSASLVLP